MADQAQGIGTRTLRGMFWAYGSYVGGRGLVLISTAILARILTPKEFGLVAAALVVTSLLERLADFGLGQALVVQDESVVMERAETAFTASLVLGGGLAIVIAALSPLAASFFDQPGLATLLAVLGLNFFLASFSITHYSLAQKRLDFRARTAAEFADVLVRGGVSIGLALAGAGAYSLVVGYLAGTVALGIALWVMVDFRPRLRFDRSHLPELARFGGGLSALGLLTAGMGNVDNIFVGRVLGPAALGLYALGYRLPELLIMNLAIVAGEVLFPAMASVARDGLPRAFQASLRYTLLLALPMAAGMAVLAEPLLITAFGPQWHDAVAPMQMLALYSFVSAAGIPAGTAYKASGRLDVLVKLAIPRFLLLIGALAVFAGDGLVAAAGCQAAVAALFETAGILLATRLLDTPLTGLLRLGLAPIAASGGMALALFGVTELIGPLGAQLAVGVLVGALVYGALVWAFARDDVRRLRSMAFPSKWMPNDVVTETDVIA
jgi:PST family polysaccharide transporter